MNTEIQSPDIEQKAYMQQSDIVEMLKLDRSERRNFLIKNLVIGQKFFRPSLRNIETYTYVGYYGGVFMGVKGSVRVSSESGIPMNAFPIGYFIRDLSFSEGESYKMESYYLCENKAKKAMADGLVEKAEKIRSQISDDSLLERITRLLDKNNVEYYVKVDEIDNSIIVKPPQDGYGHIERKLAISGDYYFLLDENGKDFTMKTKSEDQAAMLICSQSNLHH